MKMRFDFRYVLTSAALLIVFTPIAGRACSCFTPGPCGTGWKGGQVVFLGEVTAKDSVRREGADPNTALARLAVHLTVREVFSGPAAAAKDIVVHTGMGGGDCGYPFIVGQSYLVFASTYQDQLITSICSSTTPAVMGAALMQQLRAKAGEHAATLFGLIGTAPRGSGYEDLIESKALPGVKVRAVAAEGLAYSAISDAH